jgi:hypothetical protein
MSVEFVTFFADNGKGAHLIKGDLTGPQQIDLLIRSAKRIHPDAKVTILSDRKTSLEEFRGVADICRFDLDNGQIMLERMRVQNDYLQQTGFERPIILLDTDILVCGDVSHVFAENFDAGFTWRKSNEMPINGGVIYLNNRNVATTRKLFDTLFTIYHTRYAGASAWYGDQFAIMNFLKLTFDEIYASPEIERHGARIKLLPCAVYNFSPRENRPNLRNRQKAALIYHFKGMSRRMMKPFWDLHLNGQDEPMIIRSAKMFWQNLRLRLQRKAYRRALRKDIKRFNCGEQNDAAWVDRAEIAAEFISQASRSAAEPQTVADIGCGDGKLGRILQQRGENISYRGYDLVPQSEDFVRFDVDKNRLPECDIAVLLGVLEYSADVRVPLKMLQETTKILVISHAVSDHRKMSASALHRMNWKTHLSSANFSSALSDAGFTIIESRLTANQKSIVWYCAGRPEE